MQKRDADEAFGDSMTDDQREQMHVKGKLKKYSRLAQEPDEHNLIPASYTDSDSDDDDDVLLVGTEASTLPIGGHNPNFDSDMNHGGMDNKMYENSPNHSQYNNMSDVVIPLRPSKDQIRARVALKLEKDKQRVEANMENEYARADRAKVLDSLQIKKDQILLQFVQEHMDARSNLLRNIQFIATKMLN